MSGRKAREPVLLSPCVSHPILSSSLQCLHMYSHHGHLCGGQKQLGEGGIWGSQPAVFWAGPATSKRAQRDHALIGWV